jgi:hypothetical protein
MRGASIRFTAFAASIIASAGAWAQLNLPQIIQLPEDDFVWTWGQAASVDERSRPDFRIQGGERSFRCTLTGSFRPGSRYREFYNLREFEQTLSTTIYFIQESTALLNDLYLENEIDWAIMDCIIPESTRNDEEQEQRDRVDRALERAERQRERRRSREDDE